MTKSQAAALEDGMSTGTFKAHARTVQSLVAKGWAAGPFQHQKTDGLWAEVTPAGRAALADHHRRTRRRALRKD